MNIFLFLALNMAEKGHEKGENNICQLAVMLHASYQTNVRGSSISKSSPAKFAANMTTPRLAGDWGSFFSGESNQETEPMQGTKRNVQIQVAFV